MSYRRFRHSHLGRTLLVFVVAFSTCLQSTSVADFFKPYFVVVSGAREIKQTKVRGSDQVSYRVEAKYPASDVLVTIKKRLKQTSWTPLSEDWLNPGLPSSHVRGWTYFDDETTRPRTNVHQWLADWTNRSGDILRYQLEYRCPRNLCASTEDLHDLRVVAIFIPAELARQTQPAAVQVIGV